jgi:hypothetical protein
MLSAFLVHFESNPFGVHLVCDLHSKVCSPFNLSRLNAEKGYTYLLDGAMSC